MPTIANLGIAGAGLATAGGLIGGGYFILKNDPKPVAELLEIRKRISLKKDGDAEEWKKAWQNYLSANTIEVVEEPKNALPEGPEHKPKTLVPKKTKKLKDNDIGQLNDGAKYKNGDKQDTVPESFQNKCIEESQKKQNGIGTSGYKQFEDFCTKVSTSDDD